MRVSKMSPTTIRISPITAPSRLELVRRRERVAPAGVTREMRHRPSGSASSGAGFRSSVRRRRPSRRRSASDAERRAYLPVLWSSDNQAAAPASVTGRNPTTSHATGPTKAPCQGNRPWIRRCAVPSRSRCACAASLQRVVPADLDADVPRPITSKSPARRGFELGTTPRCSRKSVGRVRYSEPRRDSSSGANGGTGPEELPKLTMRPRGRRQSSERSKVSSPTES